MNRRKGQGPPFDGGDILLRRTALFLLCGLVVTAIQAEPPVLQDQRFFQSPPRIIRACCTFGVDLRLARMPFLTRTDVIDVQELGRHQFLGGHHETNGIVYTHRGGFIDIAHLRDVADWTGYLFHLIEQSAGNDEAWEWFLGDEGGEKTLRLIVPPTLDRAERAELAGMIAYDLGLWHEIGTWFGISSIPLVPERYSSFSPEDLYSNLLGSRLGVQAILSELDFEEAMTCLLEEILDSMEAVPSAEDTRLAMEAVEGLWWSREYSLPSGRVLLHHAFDRPAALTPLRLQEDEARIQPWVLAKANPALAEYYLLYIELKRLFALAMTVCGKPYFQLTQHDLPHINSCIEARALKRKRRPRKGG